MTSHMTDPAQQLAEQLWEAQIRRSPCEPSRQLAEQLGWPAVDSNAYAVQRHVAARRIAGGDHVVGRKVGLTTPSVRAQIGVDQPDYGLLWSSTAYGDGSAVPMSEFIQPKLEAEVALVLERDIDNPHATVADLVRATAYALPALEIVDCRIRDWNIKFFDLVCDNAAAAGFVLGADPKRLHQVALRDARMSMTRGGEVVATGLGRDCMGHPLNAAVWLARQAVRAGQPLRAGEIVMTGALGPMVTVGAHDRFEAHVEGLGSVCVEFA